MAAPRAKAFICDLMVGGSALGDIFSVLKRSLSQGQLLATLKLLFRLRFSAYYNVRKANGFLVLSEREWLGICERLELKAEFIREPLTMQQERQNLFIQF